MGVSSDSLEIFELILHGKLLARPEVERKWIRGSAFVHSSNICGPYRDTDIGCEEDMSMALQKLQVKRVGNHIIK